MEFNEEQYFSDSDNFQAKNPKFAQLLINWGLVKDANSANVFLIVFAIIVLIVSLFFWAKIFKTPGGNNVPPRADFNQEQPFQP